MQLSREPGDNFNASKPLSRWQVSVTKNQYHLRTSNNIMKGFRQRPNAVME